MLLADRAGVTRVLVASLALQALAIALYLVAAEPHALAFSRVDVLGCLLSTGARCRSTRSSCASTFSEIMGSVFQDVVVDVATDWYGDWSAAGGWSFDRSGGYGWLFVTSAVAHGRWRFNEDGHDRSAASVPAHGSRPVAGATTRLQSSPAVTAVPDGSRAPECGCRRLSCRYWRSLSHRSRRPNGRGLVWTEPHPARATASSAESGGT